MLDTSDKSDLSPNHVIKADSQKEARSGPVQGPVRATQKGDEPESPQASQKMRDSPVQSGLLASLRHRRRDLSTPLGVRLLKIYVQLLLPESFSNYAGTCSGGALSHITWGFVDLRSLIDCDAQLLRPGRARVAGTSRGVEAAEPTA